MAVKTFARLRNELEAGGSGVRLLGLRVALPVGIPVAAVPQLGLRVGRVGPAERR